MYPVNSNQANPYNYQPLNRENNEFERAFSIVKHGAFEFACGSLIFLISPLIKQNIKPVGEISELTGVFITMIGTARFSYGLLKTFQAITRPD